MFVVFLRDHHFSCFANISRVYMLMTFFQTNHMHVSKELEKRKIGEKVEIHQVGLI